MIPQFYLGHWIEVISVTNEGLSWYSPTTVTDSSKVTKASFVLFFEESDLEKRLSDISKELPQLEYEATFKPGFMDDVLYRLNPYNLNQTIVLYRNKSIIPEKIAE